MDGDQWTASSEQYNGQTYEEVVGEEPACISREIRHEVDDQVVDEDADRREGYVGQRVGNRYSSRTIEGIVRLLLEDGTAEHLYRHLHEKMSDRLTGPTTIYSLHRRYPECT